MLISEIKELPLRYQDHAGPKSQKFTSLFDQGSAHSKLGRIQA
jgi:hypothetical protein